MTTTERYTKARKMGQTGTHTNNEAEDEDDNRDTGIRVGDNATETIAKITIHGKEMMVSLQEEKVHGRSSRKQNDWNQDHGDVGEKETSQFSLWLKRLSSEMRRGMKMLFGQKQRKKRHKNHRKKQRKQQGTKRCRTSKQK